MFSILLSDIFALSSVLNVSSFDGVVVSGVGSIVSIRVHCCVHCSHPSQRSHSSITVFPHTGAVHNDALTVVALRALCVH